MGVEEGRALSASNVVHHFPSGPVAFQDVGSIAFLYHEVRKARHQPRDASPGGLHFNRNGDGVPVVLDEEDDRELQVACRVQGLPELALGGGAISGGSHHHFVLLEIGDVLLEIFQKPGPIPGFRRAHGLQELSAGGRRSAGDLDLRAGGMPRHLPPPGLGAVGGAHGLEKLVQRRKTQGQGEGAVPVIEVEPVVARPEVCSQGHLNGFVAGARDLEEGLVLPLQADFPVVQLSGCEHGAVETKKVLGAQPLRQRGSLQCPLPVPLGDLSARSA